MPKCNAELQLGDDYGDNSITFHCQLKRGHIGSHVEEGNDKNNPYTVAWERDVRVTRLVEKIGLLTKQGQCFHHNILPKYMEKGNPSDSTWCEDCGLELWRKKPMYSIKMLDRAKRELDKLGGGEGV